MTIATFVGPDQKNWNKHLYEFWHARNTVVQSSTKVSPAFLYYMRHLRSVESLRREAEASMTMMKIRPEIWKDRVKR